MSRTNEDLDRMLKNMKGWCLANKAYFIYNKILEHKPKVCLEIGVHSGRSLLPGVLALSDIGDGEFYAIDPYSTEEAWQIDINGKKMKPVYVLEEVEKMFYSYLKMANETYNVDLSKIIKTRKMRSDTFFKEEGNKIKFDYVHIDGNHSYDRVKNDLVNFVPQLNKDALLIIDDINWATVNKAVNEMKDKIEIVKSFEGWGLFKLKN